MSLSQLLDTTREALTVRRVFAEPYERDGVTVIAAARVRGAGGGGGGKDEHGQEGDGGGFVFTARPVGAYVLKDGAVAWQPAVDVERVVTVAVLGWAAVAWVVSRAVRRRSR
jgi:uncharacterized spore protein YtfJ